ncbi:hypothetical protein E3N88_37779 [Mikania micrantha]|uniref:Uncharacterized protein n=1 Tax=Mikania micrantha TaxID=192012 RepID=A0A5N6LUE7_9ASTR|nr:hypothetical protein E3N88_37779 [Mikania micrantha]
MRLAEPFVLDLEKLPLDNSDNGGDGRITVKWAKARAQTKTSEEYPLTKTVADYLYGTKDADNRHAGLNKTKITYRKPVTTPYFSSAALNAKDCLKPLKIKTLNVFCI